MRPGVADTALAVVILAVAAIASVDLLPLADLAWTVPMFILGVVPIAIRREAPRIAVALVCALLAANWVTGHEMLTESLSMLVVSYTAAAVLPLRHALPGVLAIAGTAAVVTLTHPGPPSQVLASAVANGLMLLVSFFVGRTVFNRRAYTQALEERARTAEASRESASRQAVLDERRRIARELHDVVAHHISVMGVMATGARRALTRDRAAADEALTTIENTSRATLREMRRLLDVLRTDDEHPDAGWAPQPGVAGLETLMAQVREAGLPVTLTVTGEPGALDPGIELTVFRIVQEALTNVLKHAGPASAEVAVAFTRQRLRLTVRDDGRGPTADSVATGHGLVGMQERVSLYGGTLRTGSQVGGGFQVLADIPIEPSEDGFDRERAAGPPAGPPGSADPPGSLVTERGAGAVSVAGTLRTSEAGA